MNSHARAGLLLLTLCALGLAGAGCQTAGLPPVEEVALEPAALRGDADAQNDVGILYVETDPEARQRLGALGRQRIEGPLSWDKSVEQLRQAYARARE